VHERGCLDLQFLASLAEAEGTAEHLMLSGVPSEGTARLGDDVARRAGSANP
jgi:hypothetical protein